MFSVYTCLEINKNCVIITVNYIFGLVNYKYACTAKEQKQRNKYFLIQWTGLAVKLFYQVFSRFIS